MYAYFDGLAGAVEFADAQPVLDELAGLLHGWHYRIAPELPLANPPMASVRRYGDYYAISVPWREEVYAEPTVVGAVCTLIVDLAEAYVRSGAGRMCLHCAAVEIDGRLIVFPASSRAGKSTLTAALAAAGLRVFTDDLLALRPEEGTGMAFGVPPRLRLPLAPELPASFREFVAGQAGARDSNYLYLSMPPQLQAAHGATAPLGAIVLLERKTRVTRPWLKRTEAARAMRALIGQSIAAEGPSPDLMDSFHDLISATPCLTLAYSDLDSAVELLLSELPKQPPAPPEGSSAIRLRPRAETPLPSRETQLFQQAPAVYARPVGERLFLAGEAPGSAYELDLIGAGIWNLLAEPTSAKEATQLLVQLFPDVDPGRIETDVGRLLRDLQQQGLIRVCPSSGDEVLVV